MTQEGRQFIASVYEGKPQWDMLGVPGIENLPAVQWKLQNIRRMTPTKHREALRKLRLPWRIVVCLMLPVLPHNKWRKIGKLF